MLELSENSFARSLFELGIGPNRLKLMCFDRFARVRPRGIVSAFPEPFFGLADCLDARARKPKSMSPLTIHGTPLRAAIGATTCWKGARLLLKTRLGSHAQRGRAGGPRVYVCRPTCNPWWVRPIAARSSSLVRAICRSRKV